MKDSRQPSTPVSLAVVSDIHYACAAERARRDYDLVAAGSWPLRLLTSFWNRHIWMRDHFAHNHLLDDLLDAFEADRPDWVVGNGDYSCDTGFVGVSDDAASASAKECLERLRRCFGDRLVGGIGDHELGKKSLVGGRGGMRLASWYRAQEEIGLKAFWKLDLGVYTLMGVTSSVVALPVFAVETDPVERGAWEAIRQAHLETICQGFAEVADDRKIILFCHDPTALPYLWNEAAIRAKAPQLERTIIGHLHSPFIWWQAHLLAGMPAIPFLGNSIRRFSTALRQARAWRPFRVVLCPSLAGMQLFKDGGYLRLQLDPEGRFPLQIRRHRLPWKTVPPKEPVQGAV